MWDLCLEVDACRQPPRIATNDVFVAVAVDTMIELHDIDAQKRKCVVVNHRVLDMDFSLGKLHVLDSMGDLWNFSLEDFSFTVKNLNTRTTKQETWVLCDIDESCAHLSVSLDENIAVCLNSETVWVSAWRRLFGLEKVHTVVASDEYITIGCTHHIWILAHGALEPKFVTKSNSTRMVCCDAFFGQVTPANTLMLCMRETKKVLQIENTHKVSCCESGRVLALADASNTITSWLDDEELGEVENLSRIKCGSETVVAAGANVVKIWKHVE